MFRSLHFVGHFRNELDTSWETWIRAKSDNSMFHQKLIQCFTNVSLNIAALKALECWKLRSWTMREAKSFQICAWVVRELSSQIFVPSRSAFGDPSEMFSPLMRKDRKKCRTRDKSAQSDYWTEMIWFLQCFRAHWKGFAISLASMVTFREE